MNQFSTSKIIFGLFVLGVLFTFSCGKKCSDKVCDAPQGPVLIELRDSQDRDLLNPATPNHYDTTKIKALNGSQILVLPIGYPYASNPDRIKLVLGPDFEDAPTKLHLSDAAADDATIYAQMKPVSKDCCTYFDLTSFTYNGKAYTDSLKSRYFVIKK
ncbi:hypothetical protein SAMN05216464_114107 [Mucilaginibacter pineti]|uniref:Uncharacterized protein n=1 Tax=Mucilaginibacter pineti TaxID=1391627 RepID=A0A1G7JAV4_9SPHI|nr:hypothetical protein [Mucilaginibacter pineti]SDF21619.1 hypothetical protein SAMN05216464_114107 [Mucilaginibacter pineti]